MKKRFGVFVLLGAFVLLALTFSYGYFFGITGNALASGDDSFVSRSFSGNSPDENIIVTLDVDIDSDYTHSVYAIEENVPSGLTISNYGDASLSGNTLRWGGVDSDGLGDSSLTYTVRGSEGSYNFNGEYIIDGMDEEEGIRGSSNLVLSGDPDEEAPVFDDYNVSRPESYSRTFITRVDFNWTDNVGVSSGKVEANFTGEFVNYTGVDWSGNLGAGSYSVRGWAVDDAGNWQASDFYEFVIPKANPSLSLTLNEEEDDISISAGGEVNVLVSSNRDFVLYQDGEVVSYGLKNFDIEGNYNFTTIVFESANYTSRFITRFVEVSSNPAHDYEFDWDESSWRSGTTNFSEVNLDNFEGRFVNDFGEISFLNNLSVSRNLNILNRIVIFRNSIFVNSTFLPEFNRSAELKFRGLSFVDPRILKDGERCSDCTEKSYSDGVFTVEVSSFSNYTVEESYVESSGDDDERRSTSGSSPSSDEEESEEDDPSTDSYSSTAASCVEDYSCGNWSGCEDGLMSRTCVDSAGCEVNKVEEMSCQEESLDINWFWIFVVFFGVILIGTGVILYFYFRNNNFAARGITEATSQAKVNNYIQEINSASRM